MSKCHKCNFLSRKIVHDYVPYHELVGPSFVYQCIDGRVALTTDELVKECSCYEERLVPKIRTFKILKMEEVQE